LFLNQLEGNIKIDSNWKKEERKNLQNWQGTTTMMPGKFVFAFFKKKLLNLKKERKNDAMFRKLFWLLSAVQKRTHGFFFFFLTCNAALVAVSKTSRTPSLVLAEHSR